MNWPYNKHHRIPKRLLISLLAILQVVLLALPPDVAAYVGESLRYRLTSGTISEGGSKRASSAYKISHDTIGEIVGTCSSATYRLASGFVATATVHNYAPKLEYIKPQVGSEGILLEVTIRATDDDGDSLSFTCYGEPSNATFIDNNNNTATFFWTPTHEQSGNYEVTFRVTDGKSDDTQTVPISIGDVNRPPEIDPTSIGDTYNIEEDKTLTFTVKATDYDGNNISFSSPNKPDEATLTDHGNGTATFSWTPDFNDQGQYPDVEIKATDDDPLDPQSDSEFTDIIVKNVNRPPQLIDPNKPIPNIEVREAETAVIHPEQYYEDPDGEQLTYSYDSQTANFDEVGKWYTTYDDAGVHPVTVTITDGIDSIEQDVQVTVNNVNQEPNINLTLSAYTVNKNETFEIILDAYDPDGDSMTFTIYKDTTLIDSGSLFPRIKEISIETVGDYKIEAKVTDGGSEVTTEAYVAVEDPNESRADYYPVMGDFNGDAVTDLGLHNNVKGSWEIALSDDGTFTAALAWIDENEPFGDSKDWITLGGDFDGDGYSDIGIYNNTTGKCRIALSTGSGFSIQSSTWLTFSAVTYDWQPLTGDFNGDGKTDLGLYNKKDGIINIALSSGGSFGILEKWIDPFGGGEETVLAGDFNGDGLADVVLYKDGSFQVAFSTGSSFLDKGTWKSGYASGGKVLIADFNSDGLVDIGYYEAGSWYYAISNGSSFIDKGTYHQDFGSSGVDAAYTGDFNGDGIVDLATFDQDDIGIERWDRYLINAKFSDLLIEADNGIGGITTISYDYASKEDNGLLPFPVHVVTSVTITDYKPEGSNLEEYTTQYSYRGGYYSYQDREFRGFGAVTSTDPITGNYTQTYFHQGRDSEEGALKGQINKIIAYDGDGKQISEVENIYEVKKGGPLEKTIGFPHIKEVHTTVYEENTNEVKTIDKFEYNNLGNVTQTINEGDITTDVDNKITKTTYAKPYTEYNRVLQSQLLDKDEKILSQKTFQYDDKGNLTKQIDYLDTGPDPETSFTYDDYGNVKSTINANNHTVYTTYEYTFNQFPKEILNELGHKITYTYEPKFGLVKAITDANNNTTETKYDSLGRIKEEINAYGATVTSYTYPDFNTKITTQLNLTKTEYVDGLGRNYKTVTIGEGGKEVVTEKFYNNRGLLEKESLPHYTTDSNVAYIKYTYDKRGRVTETIADFAWSAKDATTKMRYPSPLSTEVEDPKSHVKTTIKDVYGNIIKVIEHGGIETHYKYDLKSNLIEVKDAQNNITQIFYDSLGRKTKMIDPDTGQTTYTYDAMGNILTQTDNKGQTITFRYDAINRLERKEYDSLTMSDVVYTYDDLGSLGLLTPPNSKGRLLHVDDGVSQAFYEYDKEGRVIKVTRDIDNTQYTTQTSYDILGRIKSITYPDGEELTYTYDTNSGLLETVNGTRSTVNVTYISNIVYNAQGQILTIQYGNNTQTEYTYGHDQRLQSIETINTQTYASLQDLHYTFDKAGNLKELVDNNLEDQAYRIRRYYYDDLNRLIRAENIPDPDASYNYKDYVYEYDAIGNMTYKSGIGVMEYGKRLDIERAGPHAVISAGGSTYTYDENGNMTYGRGKDFTYDAENRLIKVDNLGQITSFEYNHNGNRIKKITPDQTITYIGKLYEVVENSDTTKIIKHIYTGSDRSITIELDAQTQESTTSYYHTDHLGSSNVITDQNGELQASFEYTPYGKTARDERPSNPDSRTTDYRFTGKELDTTGLYYYGARYYDPEIGRFITPDSYVQNPLDPQTLNRYTYCRNNPLIYIDPSGHFFLAIILGAFFGAVISSMTGGDPLRGALFGAFGAAFTAGISSALFSTFPSAAASTLGQATVYAVSAFATSAFLGAAQGARGSDLWRGAFISAGVAFAATAVFGSVSDAAKKTQTTSDSKIVETGQAGVAKGGVSGDTAKIKTGSKAVTSQSADPAAKGVTGIVNEGGGSNTLAAASQAEKMTAAMQTSAPAPQAVTEPKSWLSGVKSWLTNVKEEWGGFINQLTDALTPGPVNAQGRLNWGGGGGETDIFDPYAIINHLYKP